MDATVESTAATARGRMAFLDWLRIFAFASVLCCHAYSTSYVAVMNAPDTSAALRGAMALFFPLLQNGGAGVVVFFLVSGYVITRVLLSEDAVTFAIRRAFRIYPLYVLAVVIEGVLHPVPWQRMLLQSTLLGDWLHTPLALAGVEWTLRIEILFYGLMAVLKMAGFIDGARMRMLPAVLFGLLALAWVSLPQPGKWVFSYGYLNLYGPFLLLGCFVFLYEQGRVRAWSCIAFCAAVILAYRMHIGSWQPAYVHRHFMEVALALAFLAWALRQRISIGRFGYAISELTYSVYLFHAWLYPVLLERVARVTGDGVLAHAVTLAALFGICRLATLLVERPAIASGRRLARRVVASRAPVAMETQG